MTRYALSKLVPMPMRCTHAASIQSVRIEAGDAGNHFRSDDHHDLVSIRWWQWRGRCFSQKTVSTCIGT